MILTGDELTELLAKEDRYIAAIKKRWGVTEILKDAEECLRIGKRTELLGDLQAKHRIEANQ